MSLPKELIDKMTETMGSEKTADLNRIADRLFKAAKDCQLMGSEGILNRYGELSWLFMIAQEPKKSPSIERIRAGQDMFHFIDSELLSILSERCSCSIK